MGETRHHRLMMAKVSREVDNPDSRDPFGERKRYFKRIVR